MSFESKITDEQLIEEIQAGNTNKDIADKYEMHIRTVERRRAKIARDGVGHGNLDLRKYAPAGFGIKGTSTMVGPNGEQKIQWVKTDTDKERQAEMMMLVADELKKELPVYPEFKLSPGSKILSDLINLYTITDLHVGCLADEDEGGADYNIKIAESLCNDWFSLATEMSPRAGTCIINFQGDTMHFDGMKAVTPTSGHILDADSRFHKVVRTAIRIIKTAVKLCLERHEKVILLVAEGNHDLASSIWLREMFADVYEGNQRVEVNTDCNPYYAYEFGDVMIAVHHGHCANFNRVESAVLAKYRAMFGRTKRAYIHLGHYHHRKVQESNNFIVEQHQTLAAKDEYSSRGGYSADRSANVITYHKKYGEVSRNQIAVDMVLDSIKADK